MLWERARKGADFDRDWEIEYAFRCDDEKTAQAFAASASSEWFDAQVATDGEPGDWEVWCVHKGRPKHSDYLARFERLKVLAQPYNAEFLGTMMWPWEPDPEGQDEEP